MDLLRGCNREGKQGGGEWGSESKWYNGVELVDPIHLALLK